VLAGRLPPDPTGPPAEGRVEGQAFGTRTVDWLVRSAWRAAAGIPQGAMESTGADWTPGVNRRAGHGQGFLVHARQVTRGPGRQPANAAACWLATRMRYGVLHARWRPPAGQRE
jgi:hypothetical protein